MNSLKPFTISVTDTKLSRISCRLREFYWDDLPDIGSWAGGSSKDFMRGLTAYWLNEFDWRKQERRLNELPQFIATVDGVDVHFFYLKGSTAAARPLLLMHGWPGSSFEFLDIAEPLAFPEKFGGNKDESFDIIIPCLPGYGFSGPIPRPIDPRKIAKIFNTLMTDVLGYKKYLAQGGDWGSAVASWIGFDFAESCCGIHLNMLFMQPTRPPAAPAERLWAQQFAESLQRECAYAQLQGTKPQTLAYAMVDNPVAVAAWIIEKFAAWSDLPRDNSGAPDLLARYSYDQLLTNIMFYVATDSFPTSTWLYYALMSQGDLQTFPAGQRCETPVGFAAFPDPVFPPMPQSFTDQTYNIVHWSDMPQGGHFAAIEQPQLLIEDIRAFVRNPVVKF